MGQRLRGLGIRTIRYLKGGVVQIQGERQSSDVELSFIILKIENHQISDFDNCFRLRINGFNAARISTVQGLTQAGVQIVVIEDVTVVNWHWPQRARIAPSKN